MLWIPALAGPGLSEEGGVKGKPPGSQRPLVKGTEKNWRKLEQYVHVKAAKELVAAEEAAAAEGE